jgi:23S rRNA (adenine2030-N6)-methyltransferase
LLENYLGAVRALNPDGALKFYPGSPALVRAWLRRQDRLIACELEPGAAQALTRHIGRDKRVKVIAIDGWTGLSAFIPPKERRGLALIDPPYERSDEFSRLADALCAAHAKWPTGIFYAWYPVKTGNDARQLCRTLAPWAADKSLRVELLVEPAESATGLRGSGQIIINPPWTLAAELRILLPALAKILAPSVRNAVSIGPLAA